MHAALIVALALAAGPECGQTDAACGCETCGPVVSESCTTPCCPDGGVLGCLRDWFGPMPQTCYSPRFGCYPGNNRCTHRYPAFHGYYYRKPYNYRMAFDYPWHASPHEPQGYGDCGGESPQGQPITPSVEYPSIEPMPMESAPPRPTPAQR